jgi:tRNA threonylcarbamoyl adenosine modification protein (Sua5/YciO/YrdC/YwlC family)
MLIKIFPENPNIKDIRKVAGILQKGGIIICPTDTVYGICCDIYNRKAVEKIAFIKGIRPEKANFSFICHDLSHLSDFTAPIENDVYKLMRRNFPGPFTFILKANNKVPKLFQSNKKTVGIRIPDNNIAREIVRELGNPIMSTSVHDDDYVIEYTTDPELIHERYKDIADIVIDGGYGGNTASTVVDCTSGEIEIIRQGVGILE